jgi:hypothetical protein
VGPVELEVQVGANTLQMSFESRAEVGLKWRIFKYSAPFHSRVMSKPRIEELLYFLTDYLS